MKTNNGIFMRLFICMASFLLFAKGEFYTAISDLESLLHTEGALAETLEKYIETEEKKLQQVKWLSKEYETMYKAAIGNVEGFLSNPVNAYLLVKRLSTDWKAAGKLIDESNSRAIMENITNQALVFPNEEDLNGAAAALIRLQNTYLLNTTKIARGEIKGTSTASQLSAGDCFALGIQAFVDSEYRYCILWMQEALRRLEAEEIKTADKFAILEKIAFCNFMLQDIQKAIDVMKAFIKEDPHHLDAYQNLAFYENSLSEMQMRKKGDRGDIENEEGDLLFHKEKFPQFDKYEKLCRGEAIETTEDRSKLFCQYTTNNSTYLLLQPVKEEILSTQPRIVMFYDVIADREIEIIKRLAQPMLKRATVQNSVTGKVETAPYRVSKSTWLEDWHHPVIAHTSRVIEEITGLSTDTSETLHVINYGIGGHYEPHLDFNQLDFNRERETDGFAMFGTGNRIATWIYYLSDVDAGGSTVFPSIGVQVKPKKGAAAFWYNLKKNGDGDLNTIHAACPVLAGSKWIANKWLHERGQEFRRPCSTDFLE